MATEEFVEEKEELTESENPEAEKQETGIDLGTSSDSKPKEEVESSVSPTLKT
jgi:hypothetical protein